MSERQPCLVLIVEDDPVQRDLLRQVLREEGHDAVTADDGAEALRFVAWRQPDVILLDLMMPVVDGIAFARAYRQRPGPPAPLVVLSASNEALAQAQAEVMGAAAYLAKPYDLDALLGLLARVTADAACGPENAA